MMPVLFAIIKKNFLILANNKLSTSVVLLGPLVLFALTGLAFSNSGLRGIDVSVYSNGSNNLTERLIEKLDVKGTDITISATNQSCIDDVANSDSHVCLIFPENYNLNSKITFYVDFSRMNVVWTIINLMSGSISDLSSEVGLQTTEKLLNIFGQSSEFLQLGELQVRNITSTAISIDDRISTLRSSLGLKIETPDVKTEELQSSVGATKNFFTDYNQNVRVQLDESEQQLNNLKQRVDKAKTDLSQQKQDQIEIRDQIDTLFWQLGCGQEEVIDLTPYRDDSNQMFLVLEGLPRSDCSLIFTFSSDLNKSIEQFTQAEHDLEEMSAKIDEAQTQVEESKKTSDVAEAESNVMFESFGEKIRNIDSAVTSFEDQTLAMQQRQTSLQKELADVSETLGSTVDSTGLLSEALGNLSSTMAGISLIDPVSIVTPLKAEAEPVKPLRSVADYLYPSLLALIITFVGIILTTTVVMKERNSSAYFRNIISPTPDFMFISGTYITVLTVMLAQVLVIAFFTFVFLDANVFSNAFTFFTSAALAITVFIGVGMIIAYYFNSVEVAIIFSISITSVLFLFSSFVIPLENMGPLTHALASLNPFLIAENIFRRIVLSEDSLWTMWHSLLLLVTESLIFFLGSFGFYRRAKSRS